MKQHITRAYNSFAVNDALGTITKTSKEPRLADEINYYKLIHSYGGDCSLFFPRLVSSDSSSEIISGQLEYYAYDNLGDYMVYGSYDQDFWTNVSSRIQSSLELFSLHTQEIDAPTLRAMYLDKTLHYYKDLVDRFPKFTKLSGKKDIVINGHKRRNFDFLWSDVEKIISETLLDNTRSSIIHGDFCFSNILCGVNSKTNTTLLKFVDPRGSFGKRGIYGDPLYDAAKLLHSYEGGYEYIIYDQYELKEDDLNNSYNFSFSNDNISKIAEVFGENTSLKSQQSKLIEGLIYIGMCSRHYDSESRQTIMYLTGLEILNNVLEGKYS
jgi:hypothetical protein